MAAETFTYSGNVYTAGVAGTTDFALVSSEGKAIGYLEPSHIHVYASTSQGASWTELARPAAWDFINSGTSIRLTTGIAANTWIKVKRITPNEGQYVNFQAGSLLTAEQLNDEAKSNAYVNQETGDTLTGTLSSLEAAQQAIESAIAVIGGLAAFTQVANVAVIPASPSNGDAVEVLDSTGIESFTPLSGIPVGFVGDSGLTARIVYNGASTTWVWLGYAPTNPDNRYLKQTTAAETYLSQVAAAAAYQPLDTDTAKTDVVQTFTAAQRGAVVALTPAASVAPDFAAGNNFALALDQNTTLANPANVAPGQSGVITITQDATARTLAYGSYWRFEGGIPTLGTTPGAVSCLAYYVDSSTRITAKLISEPTNP